MDRGLNGQFVSNLYPSSKPLVPCPSCFPFLSTRLYSGHTKKLNDKYYGPFQRACILGLVQAISLHQSPRGRDARWTQSISGSAYLVGIGGGRQWELPTMDLKDNGGHDVQPPAVDVKLREGKGVPFIKRDTDGAELLPPHCVTQRETGRLSRCGPVSKHSPTISFQQHKDSVFLIGPARVYSISGKRERGRLVVAVTE